MADRLSLRDLYLETAKQAAEGLLGELAGEIDRQDRLHPRGYPANRDGIFLAIGTAREELDEAHQAWREARCKCSTPECDHADWEPVAGEMLQAAAVILRSIREIRRTGLAGNTASPDLKIRSANEIFGGASPAGERPARPPSPQLLAWAEKVTDECHLCAGTGDGAPSETVSGDYEPCPECDGWGRVPRGHRPAVELPAEGTTWFKDHRSGLRLIRCEDPDPVEKGPYLDAYSMVRVHDGADTEGTALRPARMIPCGPTGWLVETGLKRVPLPGEWILDPSRDLAAKQATGGEETAMILTPIRESEYQEALARYPEVLAVELAAGAEEHFNPDSPLNSKKATQALAPIADEVETLAALYPQARPLKNIAAKIRAIIGKVDAGEGDDIVLKLKIELTDIARRLRVALTVDPSAVHVAGLDVFREGDNFWVRARTDNGVALGSGPTPRLAVMDAFEGLDLLGSGK